MESTNTVSIKHLDKIYSNLLKEDTVALKDINLEIKNGEFLSIIGPSGCGKSTLLKVIGGLEKPTRGEIEYLDKENRLGFVFQDSVLLPWKNVRENAEFPLVIQKKQTKENEERLDALLELAGLTEFKTALPRELSGGMKQRVSIVRALSYDAPLLLMDEPFGALDAITRDHMNEELLNIWTQTKRRLFCDSQHREAVFCRSGSRHVYPTRNDQRNRSIDLPGLEIPRPGTTRNSVNIPVI